MESLALLLFCIVPVEDRVLRERCDILHVDHMYSEEGKHVWTQHIFWDWHADEARYHVRDWRMVKGPAQTVAYSHERKCWYVLWEDGETQRYIEAESFRETWSQHSWTGDIEVDERSILPAEHRRGLLRPVRRETKAAPEPTTQEPWE